MDRKSKILVTLIFLLIGGVLFFMYYKIFVARDYIVQSEVDCDPYTEACFIYTCNPDEEECKGNLLEDTYYYKIMRRHAAYVPQCSLESETCSFECAVDEIECEYEWCDVSTESESVCSDPERYTLENPLEETRESETDGESSDEEGDAKIDETGVLPTDEDTLSTNNLMPANE